MTTLIYFRGLTKLKQKGTILIEQQHPTRYSVIAMVSVKTYLRRPVEGPLLLQHALPDERLVPWFGCWYSAVERRHDDSATKELIPLGLASQRPETAVLYRL